MMGCQIIPFCRKILVYLSSVPFTMQFNVNLSNSQSNSLIPIDRAVMTVARLPEWLIYPKGRGNGNVEKSTGIPPGISLETGGKLCTWSELRQRIKEQGLVSHQHFRTEIVFVPMNYGEAEVIPAVGPYWIFGPGMYDSVQDLWFESGLGSWLHVIPLSLPVLHKSKKYSKMRTLRNK